MAHCCRNLAATIGISKTNCRTKGSKSGDLGKLFTTFTTDIYIYTVYIYIYTTNMICYNVIHTETPEIRTLTSDKALY